jgi:hypothetical protein
MDIVLKLGMGIGWVNPVGRRTFPGTTKVYDTGPRDAMTGTITAIDPVAETVDLEFLDGSARGRIPWAQLGPQRPSETAAGVDIIGPRGITSGEKIGEF